MKRWRKWLKRLVLFLGLVVLAFLVTQRFLLPWFVHRQIVSALGSLGLTGCDLAVRDVALSGTEVTDIRLPGQRTLRVGRVRVEYTLGTLLDGAVTNVTIDALEWPLAIHGAKLDLGSLAQLLTPKGATGNHPAAKSRATLPFRQIELHGATLVVDWNGRTLVVPVNASLRSQSPSAANLELQAQVAETPLTITGSYDLAHGDFAIQGQTLADIDLATLAGLLPSEFANLPGRFGGNAGVVAVINRDDTGMSGTLGLRTRNVWFEGQVGDLPVQLREAAVGAKVQLGAAFAVESVEVSCQGRGRIGEEEVTAWSASFEKPAGEELASLVASATTTSGSGQLHAQIDGLADAANSKDLHADALFQGDVNLRSCLARFAPTLPLQVQGAKPTLETRWSVHVLQTPEGGWKWDAHTQPGHSRLQARNLSLASPGWPGKIEGLSAALPFEVVADSDHVELTLAGGATLDVGSAAGLPQGLELRASGLGVPLVSADLARTPAGLTAVKSSAGRWGWTFDAPAVRVILNESALHWSGAPGTSTSASAVAGQVNLAVKADDRGLLVRALAGSFVSAPALVFESGGQHIEAGPTVIDLPTSVSPPIIFTDFHGGWLLSAPVNLTIKDSEVTADSGMDIKLPVLRLGGKVAASSTAPTAASAQLSFDDAALHWPESGLAVTGVKGAIPLAWNASSATPAPGAISEPDVPTTAPASASASAPASPGIEIQNVTVKGRDLGPVTANVSVVGEKATLTAQWTIPGAGTFTGQGWLDLSGPTPTGEFKGWLPDTEITDEHALARLLGGSLSDLTFTGKVAIEVAARLDRGRIDPLLPAPSTTQPNLVHDETLDKGLVRVTVSDANVASKEKGMSVVGLSGAATVNHLNPLTTLGRQAWKAESVTIGSFMPTNLSMAFRLENPHSLHIERLSASWAGGKIFTYSLRFDPSKPDEVRPTLYFDDIQLKDFLAAVAPNHASGDGRLYGRLPLRVKWPQIHFGNGFLFAAPDPGYISFADKELVTSIAQGIAEAAGQSASVPGVPVQKLQSEIQQRLVGALEDLEYRQLKIDLVHESEGLVARITVGGHGRQPPEQEFKRLTVNIRGVEESLAEFLGHKEWGRLLGHE